MYQLEIIILLFSQVIQSRDILEVDVQNPKFQLLSIFNLDIMINNIILYTFTY